MLDIDSILNKLPERHRLALQWFADHAGTEQAWPAPLPDGTLLATRAKGIYKPRWSEYALSVRQTLSSPYADQDPSRGAGNSWIYKYFQENVDPAERDREYSNRGLLLCRDDHIPVGVMRQSSATPTVRYNILGLAFVAEWEEGYFVLKNA
jgi:putative restriction endonuclease